MPLKPSIDQDELFFSEKYCVLPGETFCQPPLISYLQFQFNIAPLLLNAKSPECFGLAVSKQPYCNCAAQKQTIAAGSLLSSKQPQPALQAKDFTWLNKFSGILDHGPPLVDNLFDY